MNKIYRTVWSDTLRTWVAVAENARARGKSGGARVGASAAVLLGASLVAAPSFAAGMHDTPDLLNGRLTAAPLVGSMTAALNQVSQATQVGQTVQALSAAPAVLQSATVSAMNGVVPVLNSPLMDTPMASPSMSQVPAVVTTVTAPLTGGSSGLPALQNVAQTLKAPVAAVTTPLASASATAVPVVVAKVAQPVRTAVTTTAARTAPIAQTAQTAQTAVAAVTGPIVGGAAAPVVSEPLATLSTAVPKLLSTVVTQSGGGSDPASGLPTLVNAAIAPVSRVVNPSSSGTPSISLVTDTLDTVVAPVATLVPPLAGTPSSPLTPVTDALAPVTSALIPVTAPVATATAPVLDAVTGALEPVTTALAPVTTPLAPITNGVGVIAAPVTNALGGITTPLAGLPIVGNIVSPMIAPTPVVSGSIAPSLNPAPPSGLVIGTAGVTGGVGQGLAPLTLAAFGQQETFLRSGALAVNRENINARFSVVNVLGLPVLDLAPVTGTLAGTTGGSLPQQNLTLLGGVTSGNYITNINSGLTYNNGLLLPGTTPPSYVQGNNCLNVLGIAGATCWDVPAAQNNQVLIGDGASANGSQEVVIGTNARHLLPNENANDIFTDPNMLGVPNTNYAARKGHSVVIGDNTLGTANGQTIIGAEATSNVAGGVAIGFQSVADRVGTGVEAYSGLAVPVQGVVSVGSAGAERQITNVAGGTVDTDAVNLRQLRALETQVTAGDANAIRYDDVTKGTATLAGVGGTTLTNLKAGAVTATSTDAVNGSQLNATNTAVTNLDNAVTTINNAGTRYFRANSTLAASDASGIDAVAAGGNAVASAANALALGTGANASLANSVALGAGATTTTGAQAGYTGFALTAPQTSAGEVSVGSAGAERKLTNVAAGSLDTDATNVAQLRAVSSQIGDLDGLAVKYDDATKGQLTLNPGGTSTRVTNVAAGALTPTSTDAVNGAQLNATNQNVTTVTNTVTTLGDTVNTIDLQGTRFFRANSTLAGASATGIDSVAAGGASAASATNSVALGTGANATQANSVALGAGSGTTVGAQTNYAGFALATPQSSAGEVSVGAAGAERKLTNVAAGSADTDGTNVAQLRAVSSQLGDLDALAVKYDDPGRSQLTLNAGGASTRVSNVAAGALTATSTDAVNGAQLNVTNQNVTTVTNTVTTLGDTINTIDLQGTRYFRANTALAGAAATGADSVAAGGAATASVANSVALGTNANATQANSVALGAGSTTSVGAQTGYTAVALATPQNSAGEVSIGSAGAERKLTNVAAGSIDTDAANIAQLRAVGSQVTQLDQLAVKYDDATKTVLTLNAGGGSTRIANLSRGAETADSTDAVNGSQLWGWTQDTSNILSNTSLYNSIQNINTGSGSPYFRANSTLAGAQATGIDSTAAGPQAVAAGANSVATGKAANAAADNAVATGNAAAATGTAAVAVGSDATASGAQSTAVGADAKATASNSVALGSGSVADRSNSVSVGAVGAERQITNVADGVADTDAANLRQVKAISGDVTNVIAGKDGMFQVENSLARAKPAATGVDSVSGGAGALSAGAQATALGNAANASGSNATAVGNGAVASGTNTASLGQGAVASGANASSFGQAAVASGANAVAVGNNAQAQASGSMALGNGTQVASAATNSVAIGTSSVANRDNSVSVGGGATGDRQITNVRAGTQGTDAVNVQQLRDATSGFGDDLNNLRGDLRKYERNSYAGAASAMAVAGLPSAYQPGKSMASAAVSNYLGQSAVAIGVSTITDNGRWVYKFAGNVNSQGKLGAVVGAGYQF
ncbi:ESPR-type extended signal peptide-containing protein [Pigmentiphaga litoralis]|uniref:ESPR-type extended signal peptide-containing protein n=1 Tax=Pigmentiphaga litoralis TaxID=516702 RepID=UPI001678452A|nr:YadA-like family protein [Pigmentiphaga litoralis]